MRHGRIRVFPMMAVVCLLLLIAGCSDSATLTLKFSRGDLTTYRITRENTKSVQWEGLAESDLKGYTGGHTLNKMEMTFTQEIRTVVDKRHAVAQITIKALKYTRKVKGNIILDFDSSREEDRNNPLGKLIGQSYTIELSPSGDVLKVFDADEARAAVEGASLAHRMATTLLSEETIKERHAISALPDVNDQSLRIGESWKRIKSFSFDLMGAKSYERIYTLEEISDSFFAKFLRILRKDPRDHRMATALMNAVPSAEEAKELHREQVTSAFSGMSDSTETYTGELTFDLTDGKVVKCREELLVEWFTVVPTPDDDERPIALRMTAGRLVSIEKID